MRSQRQANCVQAEIGPAALVGYGKAIAADPDLPSSDNSKADAARSDDNDAAIAAAMSTDAGNRRVMSIVHSAEGMRPRHELLESTLAPDAGKSDRSMHGTQRVGAKSSFVERTAAGLFYFGKRAVHPQAKRSRAGNTGSEQASLRVFDARPAACAPTVNADEQRIGL
jgi:hypothetical protein